jgi:hypothetical protein
MIPTKNAARKSAGIARTPETVLSQACLAISLPEGRCVKDATIGTPVPERRQSASGAGNKKAALPGGFFEIQQSKPA